MTNERVRRVGGGRVRRDGDHVLLWITAQRRARFSPALDHALAWARALGKPLLVLEGLRVDYPWASDRLHRFVIEGMRDQADRFGAAGVTYHPYVEPRPGDGKGLLAAMAARACLVVTDDAPMLFLPRAVEAAGRLLPVAVDAVDGVGLVPLAAWGRTFARAHDLRRQLHRRFVGAVEALSAPDPLRAYDLGRAEVPDEVLGRWPAADLDGLLAGGLAALPIDHEVRPVSYAGGAAAAEARLTDFLHGRLSRYPERSHPDADSASGLSPWLHFGMIGVHEVVDAVLQRDGWTPDRVDAGHVGEREGFYGASPEVEGFLDELLTWRELAWVDALHRPELHARYEGNPEWARASLARHAGDERDVLDRQRLEEGRSGEPLWDAAQHQLRVDGRIQNYLRMLWGKEVLAWSETPEAAWDTLVALNDRWAIDGRDPASYANIGWIFGRFDRPWAPERPIYGSVRYMTAASTARKLRLKGWLARWGR